MKQVVFVVLIVLLFAANAKEQGESGNAVAGRDEMFDFEWEKERLLHRHNNARKRLARGNVRGQPRAKNLRKMVC